MRDVAPLWPNMLRSVGEDCYQTTAEVAFHSQGVDMGHSCSFLLSEHLIGKRVRSGMTDTRGGKCERSVFRQQDGENHTRGRQRARNVRWHLSAPQPA